ncbi:MAG: sulfatase [Thermoanaerobaculia bacterium]
MNSSVGWRAARSRLLSLGLLVLAGCAAPASSSAHPPKGILILLVDCLRADHLAAGGSTLGATPNLDRLARQAVVFDRASAVASWTRPSVPSIWTGLYPSEHGLTDLLKNGKGVRGGVLAEEAVTVAEAMQAAGYRTAMIGNQFQLSPRFGMAQGFDLYQNNVKSAEEMSENLLGWLDEAPDRPFFAYLHYLEIHWPYWQKASTHGRYGSDAIVSRLDGNLDEVRAGVDSGAIVLDDADRQEIAARYAESLAALDEEIGRLLDDLEKRGVLEETLVVVLADHGEELGERGGIEHGHTLKEELLHVPYIWRLPRSWRGPGLRHERALVETRTLAPTLMTLVGQPVPASVSAPSLLPWLVGAPPAQAPYAILAAESNGLFEVRNERFKLVAQPAKQSFELFDLESDPGERRDIAATHPVEMEALRSAFRSWHAGLRPLATGTVDLDAETDAGLRALGYIH